MHQSTAGRARKAILTILVITLAGCRAQDRTREQELYTKIKQHGHAPKREPGKTATIGREAIVAECAHEPYANASKGLIVGEAGMHDDVFALRDRASLAATAYDLDEALRLKTMLDTEAKASDRSEDQADCIRQFSDHLGSLTDTLIQADKVQKEIDLTAFKDANDEASGQEQRMDEKRHELER